MTAIVPGSGRLPPEGIGRLLRKKQRIQQEAVGRMPESLVQTTVQAAARVAQHEAPRQVLTPEVFQLARQVLQELAGKKWKPSDTQMLLRRRAPGRQERGEHGSAR